MFPQAIKAIKAIKEKCHIPRENNNLSCIYFTSIVLQIEEKERHYF